MKCMRDKLDCCDQSQLETLKREAAMIQSSQVTGCVKKIRLIPELSNNSWRKQWAALSKRHRRIHSDVHVDGHVSVHRARDWKWTKRQMILRIVQHFAWNRTCATDSMTWISFVRRQWWLVSALNEHLMRNRTDDRSAVQSQLFHIQW